nr:hypothetical protein [Tanacetum cinerariifolium]
MAGKGCALHHWVHDVLSSIPEFTLVKTDRFQLNLSLHYSLIPSYLRTAISNYGLSLGRSLRFWLDHRTKSYPKHLVTSESS